MHLELSPPRVPYVLPNQQRLREHARPDLACGRAQVRHLDLLRHGREPEACSNKVRATEQMSELASMIRSNCADFLGRDIASTAETLCRECNTVPSQRQFFLSSLQHVPAQVLHVWRKNHQIKCAQRTVLVSR